MALSRREVFVQKVLKRLYPETSSSSHVHTWSGEEEASLRNLGSKSQEKNLDSVQTSSADASTSTDTPCESFQGTDNTVLSPRKVYTVNLPPEGYVAVIPDAVNTAVSENLDSSAGSTENLPSISGRRKEFKLNEKSGGGHVVFHLSKRTKLP